MTARRARLLTAAAVVVALGTVAYVATSRYFPSRPPRAKARLHFVTTDPRLYGELLPLDGDEPVRPVFLISGSEPFAVPAGSYRLRLTARGWLSATRLVDAFGDSDEPIRVEMAEPVWPQLKLPRGGEVVALDGRHDVLEYTAAGVRRLRGADLKPVWEAALDDDDPAKRAAPLERAGVRWRDFLPRPGDLRARVSRAAADLDGDGRHDLLWLGGDTPAVFAQSGRDGSVLWAYRAAEAGHVVGDATALDLGGAPVFLVAFRDDKRCWIDALTGGRGERLWRAELDPAWYDGVYACDAAPKKVTLDIQRLTVAAGERDGRAVVWVVAVGTLAEFDARTGARIGDPLPLDRPPAGKAAADSGVTFGGEPRLGAVVDSQFADLDGDGVPELLTLRWSAGGFTVTALSLKTRRPLWEAALADSWAWLFAEPDWPRVYRDADGTTTVLVHDGSAANQCVLAALDGATGRPRWKRRLTTDPRAGGACYRLDRFLVGPDLDGDGRREIFIATLGMPHEYQGGPHHYLFVDALSGRDGRTLWTTRLRQAGAVRQGEPRPREVRPPAWWATGADGWPQLLVPVRRAYPDGAGEPITYALSAGTGRVMNLVSNVDVLGVADLDGDGVPDLYWGGWGDGGRWLDTGRGPPVDDDAVRAPLRIDVPPRTAQEWLADAVSRYHLDLAGALLLVAAAMVAVWRRRYLLLALPAAAACAAYGVVYLLGMEPPPDRDPRLALEPLPAGTANQVLAVAGIALLVALSAWGLRRLLRRMRAA
jgi:hypothetical protein